MPQIFEVNGKADCNGQIQNRSRHGPRIAARRIVAKLPPGEKAEKDRRAADEYFMSRNQLRRPSDLINHIRRARRKHERDLVALWQSLDIDFPGRSSRRRTSR
jgi:hypothetical protein